MTSFVLTPEQEQAVLEARQSIFRALTDPDKRTPEMEAEWDRVLNALLHKLLLKARQGAQMVYYDGVARGLGDQKKFLPRGTALEVALEGVRLQEESDHDPKTYCWCAQQLNEPHEDYCIAARQALRMWKELFVT